MTMKIGERIRELRDGRGMTQLCLAEELGMSQAHISRLENGNVQVEAELAAKLAAALQTNLAGLVAGTDCAYLDRDRGVAQFAHRDGSPWTVYFASALTGLCETDRAALHADAAATRTVCEELSLYLYEPSKHTDPIGQPDIPAHTVYRWDRVHVTKSALVILHCGYPSFGAGQELEIATQAGIPVVLLLPANRVVSRMVLGCHARTRPVRYASPTELVDGLREHLPHALADAASARQQEPPGVGARLADLRKRFTLDAVGRAAGLAPAALEVAEHDECAANLSTTHLMRLAAFFKVSPSYLLDGTTLAEHDETLRKAEESLNDFAHTNNIGVRDCRALLTAFREEHKRDRIALAEARTQIPDAPGWQERLDRLAAPGAPPELGRTGYLFGEEDDRE
ncbi:MAG: helix-turn-helix transcriptional regulator [Polyangiaceae bacterium]|nr:helix-turn-helix transcriptional regulator [Polyangiaceae bacterium]